MSGVYISYPFCSQKCTFCNFSSGVHSPEVRDRYARALRKEIEAHDWTFEPETIYLGGGTPSLMPRGELEQILDSIPSKQLAEVTLECAPGTVSLEAVRAWRTLGINRVSLGVQSFAADELRAVGRRHRAETVHADISLLRSEGLSNINVDLIAGLPNQTRESWQASLHSVAQLQPPHVSVYIFEIDEDSRLGKESLLGGVRYGAGLLPADDLSAELYTEAVHFLSGIGIERYEISNFAVPGYESRHNLKYWHREPYIGFGLDAHSFDGERRWSNPDTMDAYLAGAREASEMVNASEERFLVGLRLSSGLEPTADEWMQFEGPIRKWMEEGLLLRNGPKLRLSDEGVLVSNEILQEFIIV